MGNLAVKPVEADQDLVRRHREGDAEAFAELYERHRDWLVALCRRKVRDQHVAEDLASDTIVRALEKIDSLESPERFPSWLGTIAERLCVEWHRREGRVEPVAEIDLGADPSAEAAWTTDLDAVDLKTAWEGLPERYREILDMRWSRGWSYQEIADRIGVSLCTVTSRLHRAKEALRKNFLAVTRQSRLGGLVPLLSGLPALVRRMRDRVMQPVSAMPDLGWLAGPATGVAFGVAAIAGPVGVTEHEEPSPQVRVWETITEAKAPVQPPASGGPSAPVAPAPAQPDAGPEEPTPPRAGVEHEVPGVVVIREVSPEESRRDEARDWDIYADHGDLGAAVEPDGFRKYGEETASGQGGAWDATEWDPLGQA